MILFCEITTLARLKKLSFGYAPASTGLNNDHTLFHDVFFIHFSNRGEIFAHIDIQAIVKHLQVYLSDIFVDVFPVPLKKLFGQEISLQKMRIFFKVYVKQFNQFTGGNVRDIFKGVNIQILRLSQGDLQVKKIKYRHKSSLMGCLRWGSECVISGFQKNPDSGGVAFHGKVKIKILNL
jgi:hypothetical protein